MHRLFVPEPLKTQFPFAGYSDIRATPKGAAHVA